MMQRFLVVLLLALFALQVILTSRQMSPAYDEAAKLPVGYVFLKTGQWTIMPEHPPLIHALSALPLLALNPRLDLTDPWLTRQPSNRWNVALNFLRANNDDERLFFWGRLPVILLSLLLGFLVYRWAKELYGGNAGLMALTLYAFCPTTIGLASLTSDDLGLSAFFALTLYGLWRFMNGCSWPNLLWTGLLLGCALASKTSAILLLPVSTILMLLAAWKSPTSEAADATGAASATLVSFPLTANTVEKRVRLSMAALGVIFLMGIGVLYTVYLFPLDPLFYIRAILITPRMVPLSHPYYLMGEFRPGGWWYYFLVAYLIKTPVPMLLLIPLALWHWYRQGGGWFRELFLLLPAAAYIVLVSALAPNIGIRLLLPSYPLLFIFVSRTAPLFTKNAAGALAGVVLAAWYCSTPIRYYPDYLCYFNELVGGPKHGIEYLDDSNLDFGQNLKRIKRYLDQRRFERVKVRYFTTGRPEYYGLSDVPMQLPVLLADLARTPEPGFYLIDATSLLRAKTHYGVDWLKQHELVDVLGYSVYVFKVS